MDKKLWFLYGIHQILSITDADVVTVNQKYQFAL